MVFLSGYGCVSTHGRGAEKLFSALASGISQPSFAGGPSADPNYKAFYFPEIGPALSMAERLGQALAHAWREAHLEKEPQETAFIFASTKGAVEDYIWGEAEDLKQDPYQRVLDVFFREAGVKAKRALVLSNACASAHSAIMLAKEWLESGRAERVAILAADGVGPFTLNGFRALNALAQTKPRPFSEDRDGMLLGEGAGVAIFSRSKSNSGASIKILGAAVDCEGYAATRPSESGHSLNAAVQRAKAGMPDLILAHSTATRANDAAEDSVFSSAFAPNLPPLLCTKWSIGHTLGASGLMDLIVGAEILKQQTAFTIATTEKIDPSFRSRVLVRGSELPKKIHSLMLTSLGFGGVHAAVSLGIEGLS